MTMKEFVADLEQRTDNLRNLLDQDTEHDCKQGPDDSCGVCDTKEREL